MVMVVILSIYQTDDIFLFFRLVCLIVSRIVIENTKAVCFFQNKKRLRKEKRDDKNHDRDWKKRKKKHEFGLERNEMCKASAPRRM